jgi:hypothetical protein
MDSYGLFMCTYRPIQTKALEKRSPVKFKIGYTHNALQRYEKEYEGHYEKMNILLIASNAIVAKYAESHLIAWFSSRPGIQNDIKGGEGPSHFDGPWFVYLVSQQL